MNKFLILVIGSVFFCSNFAWCAETVVINAFDWDGNLVNMKSYVRLFHKDRSQKPIEILGDEYEREKSNIGSSGPYENYQFTDKSVPFSDYDPNTNHFLVDLKRTFDPLTNEQIRSMATDRSGPQIPEMIQSLSTAELAKTFYTITNRGHSRGDLLEGYRYLKDRGLIKHLPPLENMFPVGNEEIEKLYPERSYAERKASILEAIANRYTSNSRSTLIRMSDDSPSNKRAILSRMTKWQRAHSSRQLKFHYIHTGLVHIGQPPFLGKFEVTATGEMVDLNPRQQIEYQWAMASACVRLGNP